MLFRRVNSFAEWRSAARSLLIAGVRSDAVEWGDSTALPASAASRDAAAPTASPITHTDPPRISAILMRLLETISMYRHSGRWDLMYRLAWRSLAENSRLLEDVADADVRSALAMQSAIRRDLHKMHAFVRFREAADSNGTRSYFAWFEPEHQILRRAAAFFVKRFVNMRWTIATPDGAALWDGLEIRFATLPAYSERPPSDDAETLWRTYYRSICNVARINPAAMQREMPKRYWRHLPEAADIGGLIRDGAVHFAASHREINDEGMIMPKAVKRSLPERAVEGEGPQTCRRCELWKRATQAVEGEGKSSAAIMLVGEQPGDAEDLRGKPFVGPAGRVLDEALAAAGLARASLYITNAVKHFKWEPRGKHRLHKKPGIGEITACQPWLAREVAAVEPRVIVALGATALRALTGVKLSIDAARNQELVHPRGARVLATYHPSAILRAQGERIDALRAHLISDLRAASILAASA